MIKDYFKFLIKMKLDLNLNVEKEKQYIQRDKGS